MESAREERAPRVEAPLGGPGETEADALRRRLQTLEAEREALETANAELQRHAGTLAGQLQERTRALAESERDLRRRDAELQRARRMKSEFIAIAAHELRTPMTTIVGYLDLMERGRLGPPPEPLRRPLEIVARNVHRLRRLVEDLLDVSRLESGRLTLRRAPTDLSLVLREALVEVDVHVRDRDQHIEVVADHGAALEGLPLLDADGDKLQQAIVNLVANIAKQAPEGGTIRITVGTGHGEATVRVRGEGAGIPISLRRHVFEPFTDIVHAKHHSSMPIDSAGLGLYIAKGIVELHGGALALDSNEGEFAELIAILPL